MTTCELRLKAAEIIEQRGWCQNALEKLDGSVCLVGALRAALCGDPSSHEYDDTLYWDTRNTVWKQIGCGGSLTTWNDRAERTKADVLAVLRDGCEPVKASAESAS